MRKVMNAVAVSVLTLSVASTASADSLSKADADAIYSACKAAVIANPMWCAVVDREGKLLLIKATDSDGTPQNPRDSDAWRGSIEIAIAKAFTGVAFSNDAVALDSKVIGVLAQPGGPLFGIGDTNPYRSLGGGPGDDAVGKRHRGIVTFPGGEPVYRCGTNELIGGVGVSGDSVVNDENVAEEAILNAGFCNPATDAPDP